MKSFENFVLGNEARECKIRRFKQKKNIIHIQKDKIDFKGILVAK